MSDDRPSRAYVAGVYAKRFIRWQRTSYPYLSGDAFSKLADYRLSPVPWRLVDRNWKSISEAQIIFCKGEELEPLLHSGVPIAPKVIICGNSDFEFHRIPRAIPESVRALFLQNSFVSDNRRIFTLPIGLENLRWGVNGNPNLLKKASELEKKNEILFGPFGKTHPIRNQVFSTFSKIEGPWRVLPSRRISAHKYSRIAGNFRFIACVRGNGIDTHRFWETLYRGSHPIVQEDLWSTSLESLGLPILRVADWNEESIHKLLRGSSSKGFDPKNIPALWMPYWNQKIKSFLN